MRHRRAVAKLGRTAAHRDALLRGLVTDLLRHERIRTTTAKAKALRPLAERVITLGKNESLHSRRRAARVVHDKRVISKLFDTLAPRYAERQGGYTRILKLGSRPGDRAEMAIIELVEAEIGGRATDDDKQSGQAKKRRSGPRTAAQDAGKS